MYLTFISSGLCQGLFQTSLCGENTDQIDDALENKNIGVLSSATPKSPVISWYTVYQHVSEKDVKVDLSRK